MRVVLLLLVPLLLFSAWQYTRREENENRLALVASAVALRDVDVSCPGFWTRLVEITPNAGWVDFDEHGRPSDETSLSASTCASLERVWRGKHDSFSCVLTGGCDRGTLDAVGGVVTLAHESWHLRGVANEARTQCYAVQTTEAVARRLGVAPEMRGRSHCVSPPTTPERRWASTTPQSAGLEARTTCAPTRPRGRAASGSAALDEHARADVARKGRAATAGDDEDSFVDVGERERCARGGRRAVA